MTTKELEDKLQARDIHPTAMRMLVLEFLVEYEEAISLSDLENRLTHSDRTTLYRTLKTFREHGLVHQIHDDSGNTKYALCRDDCTCSYPDDMHVHFYCSQCEKTYCFPHLTIPEMELPDSFEPAYVNFVITGICPSCIS